MRLAATLLALAWSAPAATLVSHARHGNRIVLTLDAGAAAIEWISPSTFRFERSLIGDLPQQSRPERLPVRLQINDTPSDLVLATRYIRVALHKPGVLLEVRKADNTPLLEDLTEPSERDGVIRWERRAAPGVRFYGLGARADEELDLRGRVVQAGIPLLLSTAGYGEYHPAPARLSVDLTLPDRYRLEVRGARAIDYYFYFGPEPKSVFEEHTLAQGHPSGLEPGHFERADASTGPGEPLREAVLRLVQGSLSGVLMPEFRMGPGVRASQLGALVPVLISRAAVSLPQRREFEPIFEAYAEEARDRGIPLIRALPLQFAEDPEAVKHSDEFMFGDELLAAPILNAGDERAVYLPRGIWTRLDTNEQFKGRQTITLKADGLPLFAHNGTIVPLARPAGAMELHYFPKLGAEFFLLESDIADYSQVHASPAADIYRLEIESKKDGEYEWIVHHLPKPRRVGFEKADVPWRYDDKFGNLHVRVAVRAGEDRILNIWF